MKPILLAAAAALTLPTATFEPVPAPLSNLPSRSPKFLARRAQGILASWTQPAERGADLYFSSSNDVGEAWTVPIRVNNVPGEVSDHGENSPQILFSPDEMSIYAVWNARDPKNPTASHVRFARAGAMQTVFGPAVTLDDDPEPNSHGFQGAAVGPDGVIYAAWLDMRDKDAAKTKAYTASAASIYLSRSSDGGKTWTKNVRVGQNVCPCCRVSFAFLGKEVLLGWRGVEEGDYRDIMVARSQDGGSSWDTPSPVSVDEWRIKGCPHVGPSLVTVSTPKGDRVYTAWFSEAKGVPGIYLASTADGRTWSPRKLISEGTSDPTHPVLTALDDRLAVAFQARDAKVAAGFGRSSVFYREIVDGVPGVLVRAYTPKETSITYPTLTLGMSGRTFLGWTESLGAGSTRAMLFRGRRK